MCFGAPRFTVVGFQRDHNVSTHCGRGKGFPSMKKTPRKAAQERKTLIIKIRVNVGQLKSYRLLPIEQVWTCQPGFGLSHLEQRKRSDRKVGIRIRFLRPFQTFADALGRAIHRGFPERRFFSQNTGAPALSLTVNCLTYRGSCLS
jgi:hypothetical protein